jgi:hypothetical protein
VNARREFGDGIVKKTARIARERRDPVTRARHANGSFASRAEVAWTR